MFPSFGESFDMSSTPPRLSNMLDGDSQGFEFGRMSVDTSTTTELSYSSSDGGSSASQPMKVRSDKGKALITKKKSWTDTSDFEGEVNYALMENANSSSDAAELKVPQTTYAFHTDDINELRRYLKTMDEVLKKNESLQTELEKEREIIKTWTNSGKATQDILSSGNWKEGLGYGDDKNDKGTVEIEPIVVKQKPKVNPVKFVAVKSDIDKLEVKEKLTSDKPKQGKPTEVNIGLMTKKQLKHKLKDVKNVNKVKPPRKNRNGKEGVNKSNNYKPVRNAPRKNMS
ncbi:hypothetical protein AgCh_024033 [Apium graveolens]